MFTDSRNELVIFSLPYPEMPQTAQGPPCPLLGRSSSQAHRRHRFTSGELSRLSSTWQPLPSLLGRGIITGQEPYFK